MQIEVNGLYPNCREQMEHRLYWMDSMQILLNGWKAECSERIERSV